MPKATSPTNRMRCELPAIQGAVEFREVSFRYFNSGENVLTDVSFTS